MSYYPLVRSCFTDWGGYLFNATAERNVMCREFEMKVMDCLEAYGLDKSRRVCMDLIQDFAECTGKAKKYERGKVMRLERHRQWLLEGRRPHYAPGPPPDSN